MNPRTHQLRSSNIRLMSAIRNTNCQIETIKENVQTNSEFLQDIYDIYEKKKSMLNPLSLIQQKENYQISEEQCGEILKLALKHKQANIFNSSSMLDSNLIDHENLCQCGCQLGKGQAFPLYMDQQKLTFLGPGVLLFFFFLKQIRLTVITIFFIYGMFALTTNILTSTIKQIHSICSEFQVLNYYLCCLAEIAGNNNKLLYPSLIQIQLWLGLIMSTVWIFSIKFIKHMGDNKNQQIDDMLDTASDYTIRLDQLPSQKYNEYDIIQYIEQLWETKDKVTAQDLLANNGQIPETQPLKLRSIQIIYNMENTRQHIRSILSLCYAMVQCMQVDTIDNNNNIDNGANNESNNSFIIDNLESKILHNMKLKGQRKNEQIHQKISKSIKPQLLNQYKELKQQLIEEYTNLNNLRNRFLTDWQFRKTMSTSCALLQFETSQQKTQFLNYFSSPIHQNMIQSCLLSNYKHNFQTKQITISRAAQPSDMNWLNCQIEFSYFRFFVIWFITVLILFASYQVAFLVTRVKLFKGYTMYLNSIVLQLFNRIIWLSLGYLVSYEHNNTKTDAIISLMKKSIFAQVINIIVTPLMINLAINKGAIYGFNGLSGLVLIYQFIMFFMMVIYYVLNPFYYIKKILLTLKCTRNYIIRNSAEVVGQVDTFDEIRPILKLYQGPEFPIAGGYVYMTSAIFQTFFYCHLQPSVFIILFINILGFYFITKYILFRRCRIPELTEIQIFDFAMFAISGAAAFYGMGSLIFTIYHCEQIGLHFNIFNLLPCILCLIVWFASSLNPFDIFTLFNKWILDYTGYSRIQNEMKQENKVKKNTFKIVNGNFIENFINLKDQKAKRRQSYYQYSNVKKLLNYETQLKELIVTQEEKNNIVTYCEHFFKNNNSFSNNHLSIWGISDVIPDIKFDSLIKNKCHVSKVSCIRKKTQIADQQLKVVFSHERQKMFIQHLRN